MKLGTEISTDVLIIGGGFAGLWAAIKAADSGVKNIIIVDKGFVGKTSMSKFSAGAMFCIFPEDLGPSAENYSNYLKEIIKVTEGVFDPKFFHHIAKTTYARLKDLEQYGIEFQKLALSYAIQIVSRLKFKIVKILLKSLINGLVKRENKQNGSLMDLKILTNLLSGRKSGRYVRLPNRGVRFARYLIFPRLKGTNLTGGEAIVKALLKQAKKRKVKIFNKIFITNLLKARDRTKIAGAIGFNRISGEFFIFKAKAVVLAASNNSFQGNYVCTQATTGSSYKLAYDIGATLRNMEFLFMNTGSPKWGFEGTGPLCQAGARFKNKYDVPFMERYEPELKDKADVASLVRAMALEVKKGNGPPIYLDCTEVDDVFRLFIYEMGGWMPLNLRKLQKLNIHPLVEKNIWMPTLQNMMGGIVTDEHYQSSIPGLFVAGDCQSAGITSLNGMSSAHCHVSGALAGEAVAKYVKEVQQIQIDYEEIEQLKKNLFQSLNRDSGITPNELLVKIQKLLFPYDIMIIKHKERLEAALRKIKQYKHQDFPNLYVKDFHGLVRFKEIENMLLCAELFLKASLMRTESRREHYREDYPERDDDNWLKWICVRKNEENNEPILYTTEMEIDKLYFN
ncbi:MAG: FAD-dependent oxidoreductase [Candidatus Helarchaeota archaeon]